MKMPILLLALLIFGTSASAAGPGKKVLIAQEMINLLR